ncbi:hypothetical protein [Wenxinia marina]|nr:hypothetical protein [Wenxinia marina]
MRTLPLLLAFAALGAAPGCARLANSPLNPFGWFGGSTEVMATAPDPATRRPLVTTADVAVVADTRPAIAQVDEMSVERTPRGAIVRATGTAATQGVYNADLVPRGVSGGTLVLEFRVEQPPQVPPGGPERTRTVTVARSFEARELAGISAIRVVGQTNGREARR